MRKAFIVVNLMMLCGCAYVETPYGKTAVVDLPVQNHTTINKNITVNAPPGTTVIYQEAQPVQPPYRYRRY